MQQLWNAFPNFAGTVNNSYGTWPVSYLELSRPTGRYVSRAAVWVLNILLRRHEILMTGNTCAPGLFFGEVEINNGVRQFAFDADFACGVVVVNTLAEDPRIANPQNNIKLETAGPKDLVVFEAEPFMVLHIRPEWNAFKDYLNAFQSKYRVRANKALSASADITKEIVCYPEITDALLEICSKKLAQTLHKKTIAMPKNLFSILTIFRDKIQDDFFLHVYKKNGNIVGFISWMKSGNNMHAMHVGYDSDVAKENLMYQRILYDMIDTAISMQLGTINYGRTATEIKSSIGAIPLQNNFNIYIKNSMLLWCTKIFRKYFYKPDTFVLRNPFK